MHVTPWDPSIHFGPLMTRLNEVLERYDEAGQPIFAPDCGALKHLWKYLAESNAFNSETEKEAGKVSNFDYNEFFKRLYLSRAELDIVGSVLQLLLNQDSNDEIKLDLVKREFDEDVTKKLGSNLSGEARILAIKTSQLSSIANDVLEYSKLLRTNRAEESYLLLSILMRGVERFRWKLVRISSPDHIQLSLDYQEASPVIAIDYSPFLLFKDLRSNSEQYNYKQSHQVNGDNLALVLRDKMGQMSMLLQSKRRIMNSHVKICWKNLETRQIHQFVIFSSENVCTSFTYSNAESLESWNNALTEARNRMICSNIMSLLFYEANSDNRAQASFSPDKALTILFESNQELSFIVCSSNDKIGSELENDLILKGLYEALISNYLSSSGRTVEWPNIKQIFNHFN